MAAPHDPPPTLAELRRSRAPRRREAAFSAPSLFDFGVVEDAETVTVADVPVAAPVKKVKRTTAPNVMPAEAIASPVAVEAKVFTVGELVRQIRGALERGYGTVSVEGEISNWRPAGSGHCYFTLKDGQGQLAVVMFRAQAQRMGFRPKDGDAVRITGALTVYEQRGQMQLVAERMEQVGLGALLAATRELKERLRREGLFDRKRPLPQFPRCIGVVTSLQGAALRDIVKVCKRRHAGVKLLIYPAAVQGPRCALEVSRGLQWFSRHMDRADVVLVARGGGSWEDLHGFDDERVVRAIAACAVPVITGIGHATDATIADAAADVYAPTPSAAAELVTASHFRVEERIDRLAARVLRAGQFELMRARQRYAHLSVEMVLRRAQDGLGRKAQRIDDLEFRAGGAARSLVRNRLMRVERLETRLGRRAPAVVAAENRARHRAAEERLERVGRTITTLRESRVEHATVRLEALSPLRVLERGYALVYDADGKLVREATDVHSNQAIIARVSKGRIRARVEYTE